ncbi:phage late control D family protein [Micromonospora orduensis]|uniref:Phage late control D family protein n=1 Tax=Micromonospora orduensis TaxID=1420891 RepID=A0A5C4QTJ7_9ACTN|nr:phage late control D family protein [Micromonospora orduensis]TNH27820.1 phage late control D family protein [Micromonospora orduensis]
MTAPGLPARVPYLSVVIEGQDITPWVTSVQVIEDDRLADSTTITVNDPRMIYADALMEGCVAEIDLGYAEPDQHALLLRALITKVELTYPENGVPQVKIKGEDKSIEMGLVEKKKNWTSTTVNAIVRKIAQPYRFADVVAGLSPDPRVTRENQDAKTDLAFLQDLAKKYTAKCFVELDENEREVLYFIPDRRILHLNRADKLVLRYRQGPGSNLMSFSPAFDASYIDRVKEVNDIDDGGRAVNTPPQPPVEVFIWPLAADLGSRASRVDLDRIDALYEVGVQAREKLQQELAKPRPTTGAVAANQQKLDDETGALGSRRLGMSATGTTLGSIWMRAKCNVSITGVHERFAGDWYVTGVTHTIDSSGYKTDFKAVR